MKQITKYKLYFTLANLPFIMVRTPIAVIFLVTSLLEVIAEYSFKKTQSFIDWYMVHTELPDWYISNKIHNKIMEIKVAEYKERQARLMQHNMENQPHED